MKEALRNSRNNDYWKAVEEGPAAALSPKRHVRVFAMGVHTMVLLPERNTMVVEMGGIILRALGKIWVRSSRA
jgi:hypothetical protein